MKLPRNLSEWKATMRKNGFNVAFRDDAGIWHGQDFLYPGVSRLRGREINDLTDEDGEVCKNRLCECYTSVAYRQKEYGW